MTLPNDIARCMGQMPAMDAEQRCSKRETCARYQQRFSEGKQFYIAQWLCPGLDDYWQFYIPEPS